MSTYKTTGSEADGANSFAARPSRAQLVDAIRQRYREVMDPHFPRGIRVALLDFPNHGNVGDAAIWLGEMRYFEEREADIFHVATKDACHVEALRSRLGDDGLVVLHGGGNFGDLWPQHHQFFQYILQSFPSHKIVQLPQTVFWNNPETRVADFDRMNRHENLTLFARDRVSLQILQENCPHPSYLCPDSAMFLNLARPVEPTRDTVALMRADKEKSAVDLVLPVQTEDWTRDGVNFSFKLARFVQQQLSRRGVEASAIQKTLFNYLADARVQRGCRQIGRGRMVITDRLHVHILACLMDIPHILIDNSYGKLSTFRESWTKDFPRHVFLTEPAGVADAIEAVRCMA